MLIYYSMLFLKAIQNQLRLIVQLSYHYHHHHRFSTSCAFDVRLNIVLGNMIQRPSKWGIIFFLLNYTNIFIAPRFNDKLRLINSSRIYNILSIHEKQIQLLYLVYLKCHMRLLWHLNSLYACQSKKQFWNYKSFYK